MTRFSPRKGAAWLGLAALTLGLQLAAPMASVTSAQSAATTTRPATTDITVTPDSPSNLTNPLPPRQTVCPDPGPQDYPIAGGWFFTQEGHGCVTGAGPARRRGYLVQDDDKGAFWTEFRRFGGLDVLGYPVSQPYHYPPSANGGYWYQAFEKGILQWQPENQRAVMANAMDMFTEQKLDDDLRVLGIPAPKDLSADDTATQSWLTEPQFLARYFYDPVAPHSSDPNRPGQTAFTNVDQAKMFFGVPRSTPDRLALLGPIGDDGTRLSLYPLTHSFMAQRFQTGGMQLFFDTNPQELFGAPTWPDRPVFVDPTVVPGEARPGCVALTAVGLLARTIGSDKLIPSAQTEPLPLDPAHPWVDVFIPPVAQGQLLTSIQLTGSGFKPNEAVSIQLTPYTPPQSTPSSGGAPIGQLKTDTVTSRADGSFDKVVSNVRIGIYQLVAAGSASNGTTDRYDSPTPLDLRVSTVDPTRAAQQQCGPVGLPVGN
jgi:hypothetical protein